MPGTTAVASLPTNKLLANILPSIPEYEIPPPVIIEYSIAEAVEQVTETETDYEEWEQDLSGDTETEESNSTNGGTSYEDAQESISDDEEATSVTSQPKVFPSNAGPLLYTALQQHITSSSASSASSSSVAPSASSAGSTRSTHSTSVSSRASALASLGSSKGRSSYVVPSLDLSDDEILSNYRPPEKYTHGDWGPKFRSGEVTKFSKGVPWGYHGRDYVSPQLPKRHNLLGTLRGVTIVDCKKRDKYKIFGKIKRKITEVLGKKKGQILEYRR